MSLLDYMSPPVGGSITGFRNESVNASGFVNTQTESGWIAVFIVFILYLLHLLIYPFLENQSQKKLEKETLEKGEAEGSSTEEPSTAQESPMETSERDISSDIIDVGCAFRDAYLILFGTVLITMAGYGFSSGPLVLIWISFALLLAWAITQLIAWHLLAGILDLSLILVAAVLFIITWALSFRSALSP